MRGTKARRIAELEAALQRVEKASSGYMHDSRLGLINTTAREALQMPLTTEQQRDAQAMRTHEEGKRS